jgi:SH3-like domain-containing protein
LFQTPSDKELTVRIRIRTIFALFSLLVATIAQSTAVAAAGSNTVGASGYPLPRFRALQAETVNMRTGPGTQYPILWVYHRQSLPVEIIDEHGPWRKVRDHDNVIGWIHRQLLIGPRYAMIRGKTRIMFAEKSLSSARLATIEVGVTGRLLTCEDIWCQIIVQDRKGWIERRHLWGVYKNEVFD